MSALQFPEYLRHIQSILSETVAAGQVLTVQFEAEQRSGTKGLLAGILLFSDSSELHFREYIDLSAAEPRLMYAYHYQDADAQLVFRYDNAAHRPPLPTREHKHTPDAIIMTPPPILEQVIDEVLQARKFFAG